MSSDQAAASYRLFAAYCAEHAQELDDPGRKVALLNMAQAWTKLADHIEKPRESCSASKNPAPRS
jgi:hypothetical protein